MVRPENIYTSNIKKAQQVIFENIYVCAPVCACKCMHVIYVNICMPSQFICI